MKFAIISFCIGVFYGVSTTTAAVTGLRDEPNAGLDLNERRLPDKAQQLYQLVSGLELRGDLSKRLQRSPYRKVITQYLASSINGNDYVCGTTAFALYFEKLLAGLTFEEFFNVVLLYGFFTDLLSDATLVKGVSPATTTFYPNKQQGTEYNKRLKDLQRFWDVYPKPITLLSISGHLFADTDVITQTLVEEYGATVEEATEVALLVQELFQEYPAIGYDFPLWTFTAFAHWDQARGYAILMGDGLTAFLIDAGLEDAGPDYTVFHEFGHMVQYANLVQFEDTPESTRRTELMADALAAYYAHSPRGASFQTKRIKEMTEAAYGVGDCYFDNPNHHGTPNQRAKAVDFAVNLIDTSKAKGKILPSATFIALFESALPGIVAPDAP